MNDAGNCATCHPGFSGGRADTLHSLHTGGSDAVTQNCDLCHTGSARDNPFVMWSKGDKDNGLGCMGCHGHDYGESVQRNYTNNASNPTFIIVGRAKNSGYGLRRHHARAGMTFCAVCHTNDVNMVPYGENVVDARLSNTVHYYLRNDVSLGGKPVDPGTNEDSANDADSTGLDNDGDDVYDAADPDVSGAPVRLSLSVTFSNTVVLSWPLTFDGWKVQTAPALGSTNWTTLPGLPVETLNGSWQMQSLPSEANSFFRLRKPQ